jgi:hypothetical protein
MKPFFVFLIVFLWASSVYAHRLDYFNSYLITAGLNLGYKFVLDSGLYFRTGACIGGGLDFGNYEFRFYPKPDLTIGDCF